VTGVSLAAIATVNLAGLGAIAVARRGALAEARRSFEAETAARSRTLEGVLGGVRADLAFLAASSPLARLGERAEASDLAWRRAGAEGALLIFLRGHPEVVRVVVRKASGEPLVHTGRRGGVPVLWLSTNPTGFEGAAVAPGRLRLTTSLSFDSERGAATGPVTVETEVEPSALLAQPDGEAPQACELRDASARVLAHTPASTAVPGGIRVVEATSPVRAEAWSAPGPWTLRCIEREETALGLAEPVTARYRTALALNLGVMALAVLLGGFAVQQTRRRERLEAAAREETRVRELERQLFHAERLTTVGRLAAGIAHELNNPLEGMANYLALSRDALAGRDLEGAQRHLAKVREGLERAAGIVRQVLAHADPAKAPLTPMDLNEVLLESGRFMKSRGDFQSIRFSFELGEGPLLVRGSPVMLSQVASNLVLNACEAQPGGGEVEIRSGREDGRIVAQVADRGPGVADVDRDRIFEPFFSRKESTGLGLSICHSIVRQHAGELSVAPREGGGAVFSLKLPALEP
jgi:signal transduction histidine kinase